MFRLLIVDDQPGNYVPLARLFKFVGLDATTASNGPDALAAMGASVPDVVLLDIMMPGMDGFDVLRAIRADARFDAVVVLMYSAAVDLAARQRAAELRAQGFVVKGTPFSELRDEVQRHLPA